MKRLKQTLSVVLAICLLATVAPVGGSAAGFDPETCEHRLTWSVGKVIEPATHSADGVLARIETCILCGAELDRTDDRILRTPGPDEIVSWGFVLPDGINKVIIDYFWALSNPESLTEEDIQRYEETTNAQRIARYSESVSGQPFWVQFGDGTLRYYGVGTITKTDRAYYSEHGMSDPFENLYHYYNDFGWVDLPVIKKIVYEEGVRNTGDLFAGMVEPEEVFFSNTVTKIDDFAFVECSGLKQAHFSDSITSIGDSAFDCCENLSDVDVPASVEKIGDRAFYFCRSMDSLTLHEGLREIGNEAFWTAGIKSMTLPASCEQIGESIIMFDGYLGVSSLTVYNDQLDLTPIAEAVDTSVSLPGSVTRALLEVQYLFEDINSLYNSSFVSVDLQNLRIKLSKMQARFDVRANSLSELAAALTDKLNAMMDSQLTVAEAAGNPDGEVSPAMQQAFDDFQTRLMLGFVPAPVTVYGHGGAASESFANSVGVNFVCMHVYGADHFCVYCGEHTPPEWSDWTSDGDETHSRFDTQDPAYIETQSHSFDDGVTTPATCQTPGKTVYTCSVCGAEKQEVSGLLPHAYALRDWTWTETAEGYAVTARFVCENDASHTKDVPAVIKAKTVAPTCTAAGKTVYTATAELDGEVYTESYTEPLEKLPHGSVRGFREETVPATAEKNGSYKKICLDCGAVVASRVLDKTGETPAEPETPAAEERDARICPYCGAEHRGLFGMLTYFVHWIAHILQSFVKKVGR